MPRGATFYGIIVGMYILPLLLTIALGMLMFFILYAIVLTYHWFRYSLNAGIATLSLIIFLSGGGFLLFFLFGAAIALSL